MKLSDIKPNPDNPRIIRDAKFEQLKKSIQEFPAMLELRPMVIDADNIVLGGNMRLRALQDLGYTEIPEAWVKRAEELTEEEKRRFIIVDNVGYGEWDWETIANAWDVEELKAWALELPIWAPNNALNEMTEEDIDLEEEFDPVGVSKGLQRVVFIFDGSEEAESYLRSLNVKFEKRNMAWQVNLSTQSIL